VPVLGLEIVHRPDHARELRVRDDQVSGAAGAECQNHRVVLGGELVEARGHPDVHPAEEGHALGLEQLHPPLDQRLLQLEVGDAEAEEPARRGRPLEHRHRVSGAVEPSGGGQPRRAAAHHRHRLPAARGRGPRTDPALGERAVRDLLLDLLDGDRRLVDGQDAGCLAWRRAEAAGELGKVVGGGEDGPGFLPAPPPHEIVEVGDEVPQRASLVTEGMPQSMQRPACRRLCSTGWGRKNSRASWTRSDLARLGGASRCHSRKPVVLPIGA
jgi:hypothetical protein